VTMLGLRTLPVNHHLHRFYRVLGALVGLVLVVLGVVGLIVSGKLLGLPTSTQFCAICIVAGLAMIGAAAHGGNAAAEVNAYTGAILLVLGLVCLLTMHSAANFLDVSMANAAVLFVAGMIALAAGFYGRVGQATAQRH
jgi:hypothetical protein